LATLVALSPSWGNAEVTDLPVPPGC